MNTKSMLIPVAASLLLMAGCATNQPEYGDMRGEPVDSLKQRADTYRAVRTGLNDYAGQNRISAVPNSNGFVSEEDVHGFVSEEGVVIEEAAGAERPLRPR